MPTSTNCLCILGFAGLMAGAGCTSTTPVNQSASLAPVQAAVAPAPDGLPESMEVAAVAREAAVDDASLQGTAITAVAYASPAPATVSVTALTNAVAVANAETQTAASDQKAVVVAAAPDEQTVVRLDGTSIAGKPAIDPVAKTGSVAVVVPLQAPLATPATPAAAPVVLASLEPAGAKKVAARSPELDTLIERYAHLYEVPVALVRRVVKRESTFNPAARNGPYLGLMQIRHDTAKGMGYHGSAQGLLNAETNLTYAVKYLKGAYVTAKGDHDQAVRYYSRGYYYDAKKRGLLQAAGLTKSKPAPLVQVVSAGTVVKTTPESVRGARVAPQSLPGVAAPTGGLLPAPSSARLAGPQPGATTLSIAE